MSPGGWWEAGLALEAWKGLLRETCTILCDQGLPVTFPFLKLKEKQPSSSTLSGHRWHSVSLQ